MNTNTKTDISFDRLKEVLIALKGENISVVVDSEQSPPFFTFNACIKPDSDGTLGEFENLSEFLVNDQFTVENPSNQLQTQCCFL